LCCREFGLCGSFPWYHPHCLAGQFPRFPHFPISFHCLSRYEWTWSLPPMTTWWPLPRKCAEAGGCNFIGIECSDEPQICASRSSCRCCLSESDAAAVETEGDFERRPAKISLNLEESTTVMGTIVNLNNFPFNSSISSSSCCSSSTGSSRRLPDLDSTPAATAAVLLR
jgi:hypothetical protein